MISEYDIEITDWYFDNLPTKEDQIRYLEVLKKYSKGEKDHNIFDFKDSLGKRIPFVLNIDFPPSPEALENMLEKLSKIKKKSSWEELEQ